MRVFSYRNLHRHCYSVRDESTRRVALHSEDVIISDARFVVGKKGREKVVQTGQKNVHAGIRGELHAVAGQAIEEFEARDGWVEIYYNPFKTSTFVVRANSKPLESAQMVYLGKRGAFALLAEGESGIRRCGKVIARSTHFHQLFCRQPGGHGGECDPPPVGSVALGR